MRTSSRRSGKIQGDTTFHRVVARLAVLAVAVALGCDGAQAAGGTAVPPRPGGGSIPPITSPIPALPGPTFTRNPDTGIADPLSVKGFSIVGFIQSATVSNSECPTLDASQWGGSAVVNDLTITIPCNLIVQMPAATFTWSDLFNKDQIRTTRALPASLALSEQAAISPAPGEFGFASVEMRIVGNIVNGRHIAALVFMSQQSLNTSTGTITGFDYDKGVIYVANSATGQPSRLQINDVNGRFSKGQSPDSRFNVDDENPTIRAVTGYPMCVPRNDPTIGPDDPRCPQRNRPLAALGCRNFAQSGFVLPTGRELPPPPSGQKYCSSFVMGNPAAAGPADPIATEQAPFEVGDVITYSGTLLVGDRAGPGGTPTIAVHTITANVGIFTAPGTLPVYLAIGEFSIGPESPLTFFGVPQESANRLVLEAVVTDVTSVVDIYLMDVDPDSGAQQQRWVTPWSMTGGGIPGIFSGPSIEGGITTQFTGPVPGRVRIRANKATPNLLFSPTRYLRVVARQLCDPSNINGQAPALGGSGSAPCLERAIAANGLKSGQYFAPVTNFIFPENVVPGDPAVPYDFWSLRFLVGGEGPGTVPLIPQPW
ncbi:MAG: hypothetical protein KGP27_10655 [Hyphomicrobiales bacterium]|nr:hypothetical protein [Hyphomicrobiales bacterium]